MSNDLINRKSVINEIHNLLESPYAHSKLGHITSEDAYFIRKEMAEVIIDLCVNEEKEKHIADGWKEFRDAGLLWWINMILHTFGWAIIVNVEKGKVINAYPKRVKFRGFSEEYNTEGYIKVSEYLEKNIEQITIESKE